MLPSTDAPGGAGSRAPRRPARSDQRRRARGLAGAAAALTTAVLAGCGGAAHAAPQPSSASASASASGSYGTLPTFLPSDATVPNSVLDGSVRRPAITSQGDSVRVRLGGATVLATVTGPEVPGQGLPVETPATTCTWTVTLRVEAGRLAVAAGDFNTLDHLGTVYQVHAVAGQPAIPTSLTAGRHASFELRAVMQTGEGLMRWAPDRRHIVASWDFEVETD